MALVQQAEDRIAAGNAAAALGLMMEASPDSAAGIYAEDGAVTALVELVQQTDNLVIANNAAAVLGLMMEASPERTAGVYVEAGAVTALVALVQQTADRVASGDAAWALALIIELYPEAREGFCKMPGLEGSLRTLASRDDLGELLRRQLLVALHYLRPPLPVSELSAGGVSSASRIAETPMWQRSNAEPLAGASACAPASAVTPMWAAGARQARVEQDEKGSECTGVRAGFPAVPGCGAGGSDG